MKHALLIVSFLFILSCNNNESSKQKMLSKSSGNINNLSVVIDNELWEGNVGEAIRNILAAPVDGLPQDEPLFNMSQIPPAVFSGFVTNNRTVLKIEKGSEASVKIASNVYAKPQKLVLITGKTDNEIIQQIEENEQKIIAAFKNEEIKEKQRRIALSLHKNNSLKNNLGITLNFPTAYRIAKEEDNFYWIRKDITTGTTNLMIYELPYTYIKKGDSLVDQIIKLRDSVGKAHIPGPTDGTYMITEEAYAPAVFETIIDNKPTIETKGLWDVKNAFMSGPFINYIIDDKINNRLLVIEGFAFAPSVGKRDYMFELEAIIRSLKIND
ncbi:DUF4837 family protein [Xanthomarina sp. GH4-25]|uniref:DUF4837 family protein n=1 Tax=Xanthomarina sp. GH4-25 TaxID=3349335 RepID=UPI000D67E602|nr:DUF4837 domain-containing protein [Flavobacteriaceae bacterium LYZ1037]